MKYVAGISVVIVLFVFPALSYIYLNNGMEYRRGQLDQMEVKGTIGELLPDHMTNEDGFLDSHAILLHKAGSLNGTDKENVMKVIEQFKKSPHFKYREIPESNFLRSEQFTNNNLFLINSEGEILNGYTYSRADIKSLIAHIAVALPLEKRRKIRLERDIKITDE